MAKKPNKKKAESPGPNLDRMAEEIDKFLSSDEDDMDAPAGSVATTGTGAPPPPQQEEEEQLPPEPGEEPDAPEDEPEAEEAPPPPKLSLSISDDMMEVQVDVIPPGTTQEQILELLSSSGVQHGIAESDIRRAVQTVEDTGQALKEAVVASGTPPKAPADTRVEHTPPEGLDAFPTLAGVRKLLEITSPGDFREEAKSVEALTVTAGTVLGNRVVDKGTPGTNVLGEDVAPPVSDDASNPALQPGDGVAMDDTHSVYSASRFGYAGLLDGRLTVLPPLWVTADSMAACYVYLKPLPGSTPPGNDDLHNMLSEAGIGIGVQGQALKTICEKLYNGDAIAPLAIIARGEAPTPAEDAGVTFAFPHKPQAGAVRADGSIDFRERNVFPAVAKDDPLIEVTPPVPGQPGKDVFGGEVPVAPPVDVELVPAEGVRLEESEEVRKLLAEIDGGASAQEQEAQSGDAKVRRFTVAVRPVAQIPGDVDYSTGNIDFKGNVEVKGAVKPGFKVTATGDVTVSGAVEDGAEIDAGGELKVQLGILGSKARVVVKGNLAAKFIQEANVETGGDILIGSYIHGGKVQCGGRVRVEGSGGSGGGIVGAEVWGVQGITSKNVGSPRSTTTTLVAGLDPEVFQRLQRVTQAARQADTLLKNLSKSLGLPSLSPEAVREAVAKNPAKKNVILHYVKKASQLEEVKKKHLDQKNKLAEEIEEASRNATIDVPDVAHARVTMRIGNEVTQTRDDLKNVRFTVGRGDKPGVIMSDLSGASEAQPTPSKEEPAEEEEESKPE